MNPQKFDKILEIAKKVDEDNWEIGDAMLELPRSVTLNDIFEAMANDPNDPYIMDEEGSERLKVCEKVSGKIPKEKRNKDLSWAIHAEISSPEVLETALKIAETQKAEVDLKWIKKFKKDYRQACKLKKEMEERGQR